MPMSSDELLMTIVLLTPLVVALHVGLLIIGQRLNVLPILGAMFLLLAPFSTAIELPFFVGFKYARVYISLLLLAVGWLVYRLFRFRRTSLTFLVFVSFYVFAGVWSDYPFQAVRDKTLLLITFIGGAQIALSLRSSWDLCVCMRVMLVGCVVYTALVFLYLITHPGQVGRLQAWGINANLVGSVAAMMLLISGTTALYDPHKKWKLCGYITGSLLALILLATGSRSSLGMAAIGCLILVLPLTRRPGLLIVLSCVGGLVVWGSLAWVEQKTVERLTEFNLDNRQYVWAYAKSQFLESPFIGQGWVYTPRPGGRVGTSGLHSIYMNVAAEAGVAGLFLLAVTLLAIFVTGLAMYRAAKRYRCNVWVAHLAFALVVSLLAHGLGESATIMGSNVNALMLGIGITLLDQNRLWINQYTHRV